MSDLARLASQVAALAHQCSMTTATFAQSIEIMREQLVALEARVAGLSVGIDTRRTARGCMCPPTSEATCIAWMCPRLTGPSEKPR